MFKNIPRKLSDKLKCSNYSLTTTGRDSTSGALFFHITFSIRCGLFNSNSKSEFSILLKEKSVYTEVIFHKKVKKSRFNKIINCLSDVMHGEKDYRFIYVRGNKYAKESYINNCPYISKDIVSCKPLIDLLEQYKNVIKLEIRFDDKNSNYLVIFDSKIRYILNKPSDFIQLLESIGKARASMFSVLSMFDNTSLSYSSKNNKYSFKSGNKIFNTWLSIDGGEILVNVTDDYGNKKEIDLLYFENKRVTC